MVDSKVKYGQELGPNLIKIAKKLLENQELLMLLENTDLDPLNKTTHPEKINGMEKLNTLIRVIPLLDSSEQNTKSKIILVFEEGNVGSNPDNELLSLTITVHCPLKEWIITGDTLRPFAIMSQIRKSIQDRKINGLGEIVYDGFSLVNVTDQMSTYTMRFYINAFS